MAKPAPGTTPEQQAETFNIPNLKRHILLCAGENCCNRTEGEAAWTYLKRRIAELKLDQSPHQVFRSKSACLRICVGGPIMVVYPEGVWYKAADPAGIERVLQEHILGGKIVQEMVIAVDGVNAAAQPSR